MTTVTSLNQFPTRYDLSVNEARVENAQAPNPMLVTGTALNTAGGFTGGGVGNKCILGFKGHSGIALGTIASLVWEWEIVSPLETTGTAFFFHYPYINLVLELSPGQYKILSIDPNENARQPVLNIGALLSLGVNKWRFTHTPLADANFMQVVNVFTAQVAAGIVPAMPIVSTVFPALGVPVPWAIYTGAGAAPFNNYSFKYTDLLASFPAAKLIDVYTGDGGLPGPSGTNNPTPSMMLNVGDSAFRRQRYIKLTSVKLNGVNA